MTTTVKSGAASAVMWSSVTRTSLTRRLPWPTQHQRRRPPHQQRPDVVQVLLRRDVKGIGRRGDIVTVSSGHARNYLIPNGLAVEATDGAVEQAATVKKSRAVREAADRESARAIATAFAETPLVITAKAGATGKLFGSVTAADIVEAVE
ncbi:MAG: 50S ribosomal protein L9, partial [Actinobacteria bacterium]|nr:50S ribosomal protein L9 [Actinomycetota bacterium]